MKSLLYISSLIVLSVVSIFNQSDLNVNFNIPNKVIAGKSFILDIEIDKGNIADFSKLQLDLPKGFSAELLDGKKGTFTFFDQKLKLIWLSLPKSPVFKVQIKINVEDYKVGTFNFSGKISYLVGGNRQEKILITPKFIVDTAPKSRVVAEKPQSIITENKSQFDLQCLRTFNKANTTPGKTFIVELSVKKNGVTGLGKIIDNLPQGFIATEIKSNGAIFSTSGNQVKFLWMTLPSQENFIVSYKVKVDKNIIGDKIIDGKISYLKGNDTKSILINGTTIKIIPESDTLKNTIAQTEVTETAQQTELIEPTEPTEIVQQTKTIKQNEQTETAQQTELIEQTEPTEIVQQTETIKQNEQTKTAQQTELIEQNEPTEIVQQTETIKQNEQTEITQQIKKDNSVNYRVQICALKKQVNINYFVNNHQIKEPIYANMHQGWHKYTVGKFMIYKGARNYREIIKDQHKIEGPFVTAYNNGTRITVQEALMISKDQWVQ